jgi:hypothetical protein
MPSAPLPGLALITLLIAAPLSAQEKTDPFLWLEDVGGKRALDWVEAKNAATVAELSGHRYTNRLSARSRSSMEGPDRIPTHHRRCTISAAANPGACGAGPPGSRT